MMMLQFILPDVPGLGIYQIDTGSRNGILNVYGGIELVRAIVGHVAMVPLKLRIGPIETVSPDTKRKQTNYVLSLHCDLTMDMLSRYRALGPGPDMSSRQLPDPDDELPDDLIPMSGTIVDEPTSPASPEATVMAPPRPAPPTPAPPAPPRPRATPNDSRYGSEVWGLSAKELGIRLTERRKALNVTTEVLKAQANAIGLDNAANMRPDHFISLMDWMEGAYGAPVGPFEQPAKPEPPVRKYYDPPAGAILATPEEKRSLNARIDAAHISNDMLTSAMNSMEIRDDVPWMLKSDYDALSVWVDSWQDDEHTGKEPPQYHGDHLDDKYDDENEVAAPVTAKPPEVQNPAEEAPEESLNHLLNSIDDGYAWGQTLALASKLGFLTRSKFEAEVLHMTVDAWEKLDGTAATAARRLVRAMQQKAEGQPNPTGI
jgi:hypothetical protein